MQQIQGAFPVFKDPLLFNLFDVIDDPGTGTGGRSPGGQSISVLSGQPSLVAPWTVYGWGVQCQMCLGFGSALPSYGLLGKLLTSLMVGGGANTTARLSAFTPLPQAALPNVQVLWDGSQDPPPPFLSISPTIAFPPPAQGVLVGNFQLPQPQTMDPGDQLAVGLWLTPSVVSVGVGPVVVTATYTIFYDEAAPR